SNGSNRSPSRPWSQRLSPASTKKNVRPCSGAGGSPDQTAPAARHPGNPPRSPATQRWLCDTLPRQNRPKLTFRTAPDARTRPGGGFATEVRDETVLNPPPTRGRECSPTRRLAATLDQRSADPRNRPLAASNRDRIGGAHQRQMRECLRRISGMTLLLR